MKRVVTALATALFASTAHAKRPELDSELRRSWTSYMEVFVQDDGRVVDHSARGISTSEGQSYAMLRAVWANDRPTFDRVRGWARDNLQGGDPTALPAWQWGRRDDGSWGVLDEQPASDADQIIAYALLMAARRWKHQPYRDDAVVILGRIWEQETGEVAGQRTMLPGPWAAGQEVVQINPSYLMPFAYRAFAEADPAHPWIELVNTSYTLLDRSISAYGLPPDWCWVRAEDGTLQDPPKGEERKLVFGYDAFRVAWTLAADVQWYEEPRARVLLARIAHLGNTWRDRGQIPAEIGPGLQPLQDHDYLGAYGALLPAWQQIRPRDAEQLYARHLAPVAGRGGWGRPEDYYAQNWVWFGIALWNRTAVPPESM